MKKFHVFIFLLFPTLLFAQQSEYHGRVVDSASGAPLASVSVVLLSNNAASGTTTDTAGNFAIKAQAGQKISISNVGYDYQTITLSNNTELLVKLVSRTSSLNDVVVIGYGTATRKDLTAPISIVNTEDMQKRNTGNPMDAIQGSVPGVQVVSSGAPGSSPTVQIRGNGSLTNTNPLYVVDGIFVDNIDFLNPNDIADMSVLKDASAAAIYGVKAANGVVIITTKKGNFGAKTTVTYNGYVGMQTPTHMLRMANAQQYTKMELDKMTSSDSNLVKNSVSRFGGSDLNPSTNTNWYDELLKSNAMITNHDIGISGGSEKVSYAFGLNYFYQNGLMNADNNYKRYNIHIQMEAKAFPWLTLGYTVHLSNSANQTPDYGAFNNAYYASPLYPVYDPENTAAYPVDFASATSIGYSNGVYYNPVAAAYYNYNKINQFQILPSEYLTLNIWKDKLTFKTQFSQRYESDLTQNYTPEYFVDTYEKQAKSHLQNTQERDNDYILDNLLTYKDGINGHHWTVLLGQSSRQQRTRVTWVAADSVPNIKEFWYVGQGGVGAPSVGDYGESGTLNSGLSYFGRVSYDYKNRYLLTATLRADGSSKYQKKWGYFPSVGLGWVLTQESFMKDQKIFDFLKLRGSWGELGNDAVNSNAGYATQITGNSASGIFGSTGATNGNYVPGYIVNRFYTSLTWELVKEADAGIDFTMFRQRLQGSVDYYNRTTDNVALNRTVANLNGVSIYGNWGKIRNEGFDFSLNWSDKIGDFGYNIGANVSTLKNRVISLSGLNNMTFGSDYPAWIQVGHPMYYYYGFQMTGIYQNQAEIDADPIAKANGVKPGYMKFKDQNGDGVLDANDDIDLGSYLPKITYGINLGFSYKNFDFSAMLQGVGGNKILNQNRGERLHVSDMNGDRKFVTSLWTGEGSTNAYPSAYATTQGWNNQPSSFLIESGAYLRVQNIQLGYKFTIGEARFRVFATADRPFIFTKYSGFTPEITGAAASLASMGYDTNVYPVTATYSLGVSITY